MPFYIGILQLKTELDEVVAGFKQGLGQAGLAEKDYLIDYRNVQENVPSFGQEADDLVAAGADLIFACTTPAAKFAKEAADFYQIPVVFTPVYDPVAVGLVKSWESSGNHLAGVSGKVDVVKKLKLLTTLKPNLKELAVVYDPNDPNALLELKDLQVAVPDFGLSLQELQVHDSASLSTITFPESTQFVFVPICRLIEEHFLLLATNCQQQGLPICGHNLQAVQQGAACCVDSLHFELGVQAGVMAAQILQGVEPSALPIARPEKVQIYINGPISEELGLQVADVPNAQVVREGR